MDEVKSLAIKIKDKTNELGIQVKQEVFDVLSKSVQFLPSVVGNELVLATFVPMIPSLIYDSVKSAIFEKHIPDLGKRLFDEKENLNKDFINSPFGKKLFKDIIGEILEQTNEEKIEYLKKFLVTSYSDKKSDSELIKAFFKILTNMEPIHIKLLTILKNPKEIMTQVANERKKNPRPVEERHYGKKDGAVYWTEDLDDDLNNFYLHTEPVIYSNAHKDLVTWNILETKLHKFWLYFDDTTFDGNLNTHLREIERWTTQFGKQFLDYIYKK